MDTQPSYQIEPRILRMFISYASEDLKLAQAIGEGLRDTLPEGFSDVCLDKWFLQMGAEFKRQIEAKLEKTNIFIIVYTGVDKPSFSFTGWELGYFEGVKKNDPGRRIIPMHLDALPSAAPEFQGPSLKISRSLLQLSVADFTAQNDVAEDDPLCVMIRELQEQAGQLRAEAGYGRAPLHQKHDPVLCVKKMRLAIFSYLKTTVETVLKPQKQITIKTTSTALHNSDSDLPRDAKLIPMGGSPMSIFGLGDKEMTWEKFLQVTSGPHKDSWREAITSVITSSRGERIDVDNSQIILSSDETRTYRIILTTATKYFDDSLEFSLYFVETLRPEEYGDEATTLMLKGLQVVCRYRFMFLESGSQFSANYFLATRDDRLPEKAAKLLRELNLMKKEASIARLDDPAFWNQFIGWPIILEMGNTFRLKEELIRESIGRILDAKDHPEALAALRQELSKVVGELEDATRQQNGTLVEAMANKLLSLVKPEA